VHPPSPAFIIDLEKIQANCEILAGIKAAGACRIVHALKAFALPQAFPVMREHLDGCCASGPWEAELAHQHFGGRILTCSPAYTPADVETLLPLTHHLDFNSPGQWERFAPLVRAHPRFQSGELRCGLRINPRCSTGPVPLYDPCGPGSRLGSPPELLEGAMLDGITGLHFHTLCEQGSEDLETTLRAVDRHFGDLLRSPRIRSLNLGGGHWITKEDYNRELLVSLLLETRERYDLEEIWLEPGEAAVLHSAVLLATVLDVFPNADTTVSILDVSATAHMPDVLEMPYRPDLTREDGPPAGDPEAHRHTYRLGGASCLAGDVIGDYSFPEALQVGDRLHFQDMAQYSMVKTSFFNGVRHPALVLRHPDGRLETVREFDYRDFAGRLG
jgi:carboxynorspermidine decarboxylase